MFSRGREALAYCTNVHPGSDLSSVRDNLTGPVAAVRARRGLDRMGCGLWLSATAARELARDPGRLETWLDAGGLFLFTLNGFPYGDFHRERVKEAVYVPAWDEPARLRYTLDLAGVLAHCLPEDQTEGTISSVPLGFGPQWSPARHAGSLHHLCRAASQLEALQGRTGRRIRICLEPEPGCAVETTDQAISLFRRDLPAAAAREGVSETTLTNHLGLCFDVCHQAVLFEHAGTSLSRLQSAGVPVGKLQISSALEVTEPGTAIASGALAAFAEPRYLHQLRARRADGELVGIMDLATAMDSPERFSLPWDRPWRVHFHVPIQTSPRLQNGLGTTRAAIQEVLDHLVSNPDLRPHLEVETYTWEVLPSAQRPRTAAELEEGLTAELCWLEARMLERGLL